jgi:hypothetical protein
MLKVFDDPLVLQQKPKVGTAEELLQVPDVAERKILARRRGLKPGFSFPRNRARGDAARRREV